MARKTTPTGPGAPALEKYASAYRSEQNNRNRSGIYAFDYYALYPLVINKKMTNREIADELGLSPRQRKTVMTLIERFFPFTPRAAKLAHHGHAQTARTPRTRKFPIRRAPAFSSLLRQHLDRVELGELLTPISTRPNICDVGGVRCGVVLTTTTHRPHGQVYARWDIPKTQGMEFVLFLADITNMETPLKEIFCFPIGRVPRGQQLAISFSQDAFADETSFAGAYGGLRGLSLLKAAVEARKK